MNTVHIGFVEQEWTMKPTLSLEVVKRPRDASEKKCLNVVRATGSLIMRKHQCMKQVFLQKAKPKLAHPVYPQNPAPCFFLLHFQYRDVNMLRFLISNGMGL